MTLFLCYIITLFPLLETGHPCAYQDDKIYTVSEVAIKPEPIDGLEDFKKKWSRKVTYPKSALEEKIQGMVFIEFVVSKDGSIESASVKSGIGHGCDEAALDAFKQVSKDGWKPAIKNDTPVKVKMVLPFYFKIIKT